LENDLKTDIKKRWCEELGWIFMNLSEVQSCEFAGKPPGCTKGRWYYRKL